MGIPNWPIYGEDLGSAIEAAEKAIAKIKSNLYSKEDLVLLAEANFGILKHVIEHAE